VALDPEYVLAYSGLAESYVRFPITSDIPSRDAFPYARAAVDKALQIEPYSAEAHGSDAAIKFWYEWDFSAAETAARKAIALNANYWMAHLWLGHVLSNVGRHEEALPAIQQAHLLDPFSLIANAMYGQFLYQAGRVEDSIRQFHSTLELEPRFWVAHICLAKSYERLGQHADALASCGKAWEFSGGNSEALSLAGYIHAISGEREKAEAKIKELQEQKLRRYVPPYNFALVFAGLGDTDSALHWLEQAVEDRDVHMTFLRDHKWNGLRSETRFAEILDQCGFRTAPPIAT
jgi:Flp pilus assembly protein TadD